ncbi:MAG: phosphorybosylanthranilate isomerase, partial [Planctomycetota bacterium]
LDRVREAVPDRPVFVGSGATAESARLLLARCSGLIVGTSLKEDGDVAKPVSAERATAFARAALQG